MEYGRTRPNVDLTVFAEGVGHNTVTAMDPAKVLIGYEFEETVKFDELNWHLQQLGAALHWLDGCASREFSSMASAMKATMDDGRRFAVRRAAGAERIAALNEGMQGAVAVSVVATDCHQIYYEQGGYLNCEDPDDQGVLLWSTILTSMNYVLSICADGGGVYVGMSTSALGQVRAFNRITGAVLTGWSSSGVVISGDYAEALASNGLYLAVAERNLVATVGYFECWESMDSTAGVARAAFLHGSALYACAIDHKYAYIGGKAGTGGHHVRAMLPTVAGTPTEIWSYTIPTTAGTPIVRGICCDGERVFVVGDLITATVGYNVWCLQRETDTSGTAVLLWRSQTAAGVDALDCVVDDHYLYVSDADSMTIFDKITGAIVDTSADMGNTKLACDGVDLWGKAVNDIARMPASNLLTKSFVRATATDVYRRKHGLAVPEE